MQNKLPAISVIVLAIMAAAWLWLGDSQPPSADKSLTGQRLLPNLEQQLNDVNRILVEQHGSVYAVVKNGAQWQLPVKGDYPVLFERVKPLLLGIALLDIVEPKSDKPENHARLGVQAPAADSDSMRISLYTAADTPVASLIIGSIRGGLITGGKDGIYVRLSGKSRAWLVAGNLDLPQQQLDWVDRQIIQITPKKVKRVTISHPDGTSLTVGKQRKGAVNFSLMNMPAGSAPKKQEEINLLPRGLTALEMADVRARPADGPPQSEAVTATFRTWDGLEVRVTSVEQDDQLWAWFDLVKPGTSDPGDLQTRFAGWVFQLAPSPASRLRARLSDLDDAELAD